MFPSISSQIRLAASATVEALERTEPLMPQVLQDGLNDGLKKFISSLQKSEFNRSFLKGNLESHATDCSAHLHIESSESQMS